MSSVHAATIIGYLMLSWLLSVLWSSLIVYLTNGRERLFLTKSCGAKVYRRGLSRYTRLPVETKEGVGYRLGTYVGRSGRESYPCMDR